jgi:hypothetical protein
MECSWYLDNGVSFLTWCNVMCLECSQIHPLRKHVGNSVLYLVLGFAGPLGIYNFSAANLRTCELQAFKAACDGAYSYCIKKLN